MSKKAYIKIKDRLPVDDEQKERCECDALRDRAKCTKKCNNN